MEDPGLFTEGWAEERQVVRVPEGGQSRWGGGLKVPGGGSHEGGELERGKDEGDLGPPASGHGKSLPSGSTSLVQAKCGRYC